MNEDKKIVLDATVALVSAFINAEKGISALNASVNDAPKCYAELIETVYKKVESLTK